MNKKHIALIFVGAFLVGAANHALCSASSVEQEKEYEEQLLNLKREKISLEGNLRLLGSMLKTAQFEIGKIRWAVCFNERENVLNYLLLKEFKKDLLNLEARKEFSSLNETPFFKILSLEKKQKEIPAEIDKQKKLLENEQMKEKKIEDQIVTKEKKLEETQSSISKIEKKIEESLFVLLRVNAETGEEIKFCCNRGFDYSRGKELLYGGQGEKIQKDKSLMEANSCCVKGGFHK